jgi:hypothetical protein
LPPQGEAYKGVTDMAFTKVSYRRKLSDVREAILAYFVKWRHRPVLIGQISTELNCMLSEAEDFLAQLCEEGVIRELLPEEARKYGLQHGYVQVQK